jgi:hypothetical protein
MPCQAEAKAEVGVGIQPSHYGRERSAGDGAGRGLEAKRNYTRGAADLAEFITW